MKWLLKALCVTILCATGCSIGVARAASSVEVPVGGCLRDASLRALNGPALRLAQLSGRALIINVWASWCGPCREEMSSLERLAWTRLPVRFRIIGVSIDDDPRAARAFLRSENATISQFLDSRRRIERMLGASTIPLTVLVAADGRILAKLYGARDWSAPGSLRLITRTFGAAVRLGTTADGGRRSTAPHCPRSKS